MTKLKRPKRKPDPQIDRIRSILAGPPVTAHCLLCGCRPQYNALYIPSDQRGHGAVPGKNRMIFYSLCEPCLRGVDDGVRLRIEQIIKRSIGEMVVAPSTRIDVNGKTYLQVNMKGVALGR